MLKIYNTLTRKIEEFKPLNGPSVGMYTCGPTVYDRMHIGNLRTFVLSDVLFGVLRYDGYDVKSVQNITDIDDKIIKRAKETNREVPQIAREFTRYFIDDVKKLNINWKLGEQPKVSDYIKKIASYVKVLMQKGFAYEKEGSIYFDISKFPNYGKLSGVTERELKTGTRTLSDEYTKDDVADFALWKAVPKGEIGSFGSELGWGRPGWHIECSVMSQETLGETFDIHVGGTDLIFPHHENEIAQSEAKTGKKFVNYFIHGAHMLVDGKKMSKSLNNFYTLDDVISKGFDPIALRYLYLQTHYKQETNFTWDALEASQKALGRLRSEVSSFDAPKVGCAEFEEKFEAAINNDLNMPEALSVVWDLIKSDYPSHAKAESLFKFDEVLGLNLQQVKSSKLKVKSEEIPEEVQKMVEEREELRKKRKFHLADQVRNKIIKMGYEVHDNNGTSVVKKK